MMFLTIDEIIKIHGKLIAKTGGSGGLRNRGLLESAIHSANNSFDEIEQYPSFEEKAARLAYAIIKNHAFVDGNKRIGILVMLMTLKLNNVKITYSQTELIDLGLSVASGQYGYSDIYDWIKNHI